MSEARPLALGLGGGSAAALLDPVAFEARLERARERRANVLAPKREAAAATTVGALAVWTEPHGTVLLRLPLLLAGLGTGAALASLLLLPQARPVPTAATSLAMLAPLSGPAFDGLPPASPVRTAATSPAMLAPLSAPALDGLPPPALWAGWIDRPATPAPIQAAVEAVPVLPARTVVRTSGMRMNAAAAPGAVFCIFVDSGSIVRASPPATQSASDGPTVVWFLPAQRSGAPIDPPRTYPGPGRVPIDPPVAGGGIPAPSDYEISDRPVVASPLAPAEPPVAPGYEIPDKPPASPVYEPPHKPPAASHPHRPSGRGVGARPNHPSSGAPGSSGGVSNRGRDADHQAPSARQGRETAPGGGRGRGASASSARDSTGLGSSSKGVDNAGHSHGSFSKSSSSNASSSRASSSRASSSKASSSRASSSKASSSKASSSKASSSKASSAKGSSAKGSSAKGSSGKGSAGKGSSDKGSSGRGGSGKGGRG